MKERVLITGASGFLGFHLIEAALENNMEVHAAVRKSSSVKHLEHLPVSFTQLDYLDIKSLKNKIETGQYDYIIHAAGVTKAKSQEEYNKINADYSFNLAKAVEQSENPIKKFVFLSSLAALGPLNNMNEVLNEFSTPNPVTAYGKSKLIAEEKIGQLSIPLVILRPTAVYGPRDKDIFILFKIINNGLEPYIGRKQQQLSFVYAKDVARAGVNALSGNTIGIFNLSDGNTYTRYDLANYLKRYLNKKTLKIHLPFAMISALAITLEQTYGLFDKTPALNKEKLNELSASNWICSIERAKEELGFNPRYNLEMGVLESINWYKKFKWF
ncbi:MAG TPA: NAD(P)-dependent oxidoreductase [Chitinophagaceae bacterium]|nr:NAD(P)-dependent oxidoreductase [Chitinophagaceae bacterium]